jgi:starch-binding outer membrane protein, SusD/RagB family
MKKYIVVFLVTALSLTSCNKYLDLQSLDTPAVEVYFKSQEEIDLGLTGVYSAAYWDTGNNLPMPVLLDLFADTGLERSASIASGSFDAANGTVQAYWNLIYRTVSRANVLLEGMQKGKATTPVAVFNRMEGEAQVLRAWAYFHLLSLWGDVPFYTKPLKEDEIYALTRTPRAEIVNFLIADLDNAAAKLDWNATQRGRVSRGVALGIKAKLLLLDKRFAPAAEAANAVITSGIYNLNPSFQNLFRKNTMATNAGREIMFELVLPDNAQFPASFVGLGQGSRAIAAQSGRFPIQALVDRFECIDGKRIDESPLYNPANISRNRDPRLRWTVTIHGDTITGLAGGSLRRCVFNVLEANTRFFNFTNNTWNTASNADFSNPFGPVNNGMGTLWAKYTYDETQDYFSSKMGYAYMRFAEILLTYAEAKIEAGQLDASVVEAVNRVRRRAGMPNVEASIAGNVVKMRQLVRRERTVELANEGLRLYDIRRWEIGNLVMNTAVWGAQRAVGVVPPIPSFGAAGSPSDLNDVPNYDAAGTSRFKREQRFFDASKHILFPIPQRELDINKNLRQNSGW